MVRVALAVCAFAMLCTTTFGSVIYSNPSSFCETWSSPNNATGQINLVTYLVNNAIFGNTSYTAGNTPVTGLLNIASIQVYLNGSMGGSNYVIAGAARDSLVANLNLLLQWRLGCRALLPTAANAQILSFALNNSAVWAAFRDQTTLAVLSFGVPALPTTPTVSEVTFMRAVYDSLQLGAPSYSICSTSGCPAYAGLAQFNSAVNNNTQPSFFATYDNTTNVVNITQGDAVNWRILNAVYQVVETDVNYTVLSGGRSSAAYNTSTFTLSFPTAGTYYFASGPMSTAQSVVIVMPAPPPVVVPVIPVPAVLAPNKETTVGETVGVSVGVLVTSAVAGMMFFKMST